jgi:hypothetical protein
MMPINNYNVHIQKTEVIQLQKIHSGTLGIRNPKPGQYYKRDREGLAFFEE